MKKAHVVRTSRISSIGTDGLFTLALSNILILLTVGWSLLTIGRHIYKTAQNASITAPEGCALMVLGMRLHRNGTVTHDYAERLDRAITVYRRGRNFPILVVGGLKSNNGVSEASRGREYLTSHGVDPIDIQIEESSQHTLENLRNARALFDAQNLQSFVLITSRYHLARSMEMAQGFRMTPVPCGAENTFSPSVEQISRILSEAYYLHWYRVGAAWSHMIRSEKSLARIS